LESYNLNENYYEYNNFKAMIIGIRLHNNTKLKDLYDKIKSNNKNANIILVNASLIYGLEHIKGILRIINEEITRKNSVLIKNKEIEFLLRLCHTKQISNAFKIINDTNIDNNIVVILFANDLASLKTVFEEIKINGIEDNNLINSSNVKKIKMTKLFLDKYFKDKDRDLFIDDKKFLNLLIERSALAIE